MAQEIEGQSKKAGETTSTNNSSRLATQGVVRTSAADELEEGELDDENDQPAAAVLEKAQNESSDPLNNRPDTFEVHIDRDKKVEPGDEVSMTAVDTSAADAGDDDYDDYDFDESSREEAGQSKAVDGVGPTAGNLAAR